MNIKLQAASTLYETIKEDRFHQPPSDEHSIYKELSKRTMTIKRSDIR